MSKAANGSTLGVQGDTERFLGDAEDALQRGLVDEASSLARTVLQLKTAVTADKARAINVLIQADFHFHDKLTDLTALLHEAGLVLEQLPVTAVLLWGVVAVELEAAESARVLLKRYLDAKHFGEGSGVTREDCLALSRLYAVQLLSGLCGDFQAAADWLTGGGAGLSEEQQELLLLEVDEAEELAQEEHVASWTTQDAAEAAQLGNHAHSSNGNAAADAAAYSDMLDAAGQDCCGGTDAGSLVGSLASTAVAALHELGPSVSGVLSNQSLHPAAERSQELEEDSANSPDDLQQVDAAPSSAADGSSVSGGSTSSQTTPAAAAAAAGAQLEAAVAAVAAAEARLGSLTSPLASPAALALPPAAVAVCGLQDSERVPSSPSLASWRRSPDEVAVQDQSSQRDRGDGNPFITITGAFNDQGYDPAVAAELAAAAAAAGGRGSSSSLAASPDKGSKGLRHSNSSSSVKSRLRDTAGDAAAAAANVAAAAVRGEVVSAMLDASLATAAAAVQESGQLEEQQQQQHEGAADAEQQQQSADSLQSRLSSYASWASDKASSAWSSQPVQDALKAFNLQDVPPWELAGGAAAAALLTYTLYRNRRRVRRAASDFAAGVASTAQMALGMSVNPMAAVPGTGHLMR